MSQHLSVDLETFSSVPIQNAGLYKYVQSPDFQILLCAYSIDGNPVQVIDATSDDLIHQAAFRWLIGAVTDPAYVKHAYNAAFEIACLSKAAGRQLDPAQWRCTMLQSLYCGYPASLDAAGRALGLPEEKQKLTTGRALIRYFCSPCAATNGGRTRNLPKHDPGKLELFKRYCAGDVAAEMEIARRLSNFPVPADVQKQWETDLTINSRGVAVDMDLVTGALQIGNAVREQLMSEATRLSGLQNPNSVGQLMNWLETEIGEELPDLSKETVAGLLNKNLPSDTARRMLEIRRELGKTSIKKYDAIAAAVCVDGRCRGLLQIYGANRTGRWAGRLVQVQNLPRTYTEPLPLARDTIKRQETTKLRVLFGSVPDTLSQMIRTSFIASPGNVFIDADFSNIEARVISWMVGEHWRLDVFKTHGKIYEASASQMFGVPIELIKKGNPEYSLRQRGKVAELALGYQGSTGALIKMGALNMGLSEEELPDIVYRWRDANKRICAFWKAMEAAAVSVIKTGAPAGSYGIMFAREIDAANGLGFLTVRLPSGRKLYYANPRPGLNRWGRESITYSGMNQTTKKWEQTETYGGKLVENIVQAVARDCLADAVERLEAAEYAIVFHIHDEVVIDCPASRANLEEVIAIMSQPLPWAPGLPLGADGWIGEFFKKD